MAKIFLSYRRDDSAGYTGRIFDHLSARFGSGRVFMDVDGIDAGENFPKVIEASIASCDTVVAVIGKRWDGVDDTHGFRRIDDPADYVRRELAVAMQMGVDLVPVLVGGAELPGKRDLPEDLGDMTLRNALEIDDRAFLAGMDRLIAVLERTTAMSAEKKRIAGPVRKKEEQSSSSSRSQTLWWLLLLYAPAYRATWVLHVLFYYLLITAVFVPAFMLFDPEVRDTAAIAFASMVPILVLLRATATIVEPAETTSHFRRWWLLYKPRRAGIAFLHALFFLMLAFELMFVIMLFVVRSAGTMQVMIILTIVTFLLREMASTRDPLRRKDAEANWFARMLYLSRAFRRATWIPRILFYLSGMTFLMLLPMMFLDENGALQWPHSLPDRGELTRVLVFLVLALCARGWAKSSEAVHERNDSVSVRQRVLRTFVLRLPSRSLECIPQLIFWVSLILLIGLLARRDSMLSLLGLEDEVNWLHASAVAALLVLSANRWAQLYGQRADSLSLADTTHGSRSA